MSDQIRVLMVDDEEHFRATTKKILDRRGFTTLVAASGEEAIEKLKEQPDVVVLDVKMPGMDGHQALQEIKKRAPKMPVIMLTGHGAMPSAREALEEGAFDYLSKPCDIDLLAMKITEAREHGKQAAAPEEKRVMDIMIPLQEYTVVTQDQTVREAIERLRESFTSKISTSRILETGHRSILVFDSKGKVQGILTILDLIEAIMPAYLSAPKPSMADSIQYSPIFWRGMFGREITKLGTKKIGDVMSPAPAVIDPQANLMEAAYIMYREKARRLLVARGENALGIVREQELFFEMEKILRQGK